MKYVHYGKGATSYELQIWKFVFRWCYLRGAYWKLKPWRRLGFSYFADEEF